MSTRIERAKKYFKKNGWKKTIKKTWKVSKNILLQQRCWKYYLVTEEEWKRQRETVFEKQPKLSILIPMYQTPIVFFKELIDTIQGQSYTNWELCLADGSPEDTDAFRYVMELQKKDDRIKYRRLEKNGGISENTNAALDMATGDFIVLCDHDDLLAKDAFYHVVKAINEDERIDTLYTDEDKVNMKGKKYFEPAFKPDFNIDFLRGGNYICHMFVTRREIANKVRFIKEYDGAQDFDFIFRCCEMSDRIYHIPRLLYHWRCHQNSTAANPESKLYAYEAGTKAVQAHLERCNIAATVKMSECWGYYLIDYQLTGNPKVSIISTEALSETVLKQTTYANIERIIVEKQYTPEQINKAVKKATGEMLCFLDPRITSLEEGCLEKMLAPLQRSDLSAVFARVYNQKDCLYSAGILTGIRGCFGRARPGMERDNKGYAMHLLIPQDMQASDLACCVIKKADFDAVGGMDESFSYIPSCVDLYLKMGRLGKKHMFEPQAVAVIDAVVDEDNEWIDFEPASVESEAFIKKWRSVVSKTDPVYNPNLLATFGGYFLKPWSQLKKEAE